MGFFLALLFGLVILYEMDALLTVAGDETLQISVHSFKFEYGREGGSGMLDHFWSFLGSILAHPTASPWIQQLFGFFGVSAGAHLLLDVF